MKLINQIPPRFGGGAPKAAGPAPTVTFPGGGFGFAIQPARAFAAGDAAGGKGYIKTGVCISNKVVMRFIHKGNITLPRSTY